MYQTIGAESPRNPSVMHIHTHGHTNTKRGTGLKHYSIQCLHLAPTTTFQIGWSLLYSHSHQYFTVIVSNVWNTEIVQPVSHTKLLWPHKTWNIVNKPYGLFLWCCFDISEAWQPQSSFSSIILKRVNGILKKKSLFVLQM